MGRGAWKAAVPGVAKSWTQLSDFIFTFYIKQSDLVKIWSPLCFRKVPSYLTLAVLVGSRNSHMHLCKV